METTDIQAMLEDVAERVINPRFRALGDGDVEEKKPGDLVTVADREAEALITEALLAAYPDAVVLGEEAFEADASLLDKYAGAEHAFTVDPVDGTKNFVHGSKDHAVMVAEVRDGEVTRAWIWQPQHGLGYIAERGQGAWVNGKRLTRPAPPPLQQEWRGVTSRRRWVGRELPGLRPLELTWVCCGVDYPHLVSGHADFVLSGRDNPWDHAPGSLILSESGGFLGTLDGDPYDPRVSGRGLIGAADRATYDVVLERFHS